ncbi:MAG: hypothetical protein DMG85_20560 [Acidobacteria bacterium]|nr:MAG: hypothetical protein DMG85_20560 [Acidobacteriota bacterium]
MTKFEDKTAVDFVIVGAGGAGGVVAKELSTAGFQVVVLEQGPYLHEGDFIHDELKFKDVFDPPFIGQEVLTNDHTLQPNTFRTRYISRATTGGFMRLIFWSAAVGERWKARGWPIGRSPTMTSSPTTLRRSGN